jgi:chromatin segregation and condensation protein Rec8/ScpA/Scc1 (kleisin family)
LTETTGKKEKPYYLRQPWDILFKENKLDKVSPWDINLVQLLTSLLEEMERVGIDYRIAGTAVNSSVYIYLKKAEMLLAMEEPPAPPEERGDVYLPPPVPLPFRFEFTTTSVQDLINALERALQEESGRGEVPRLPTLPIPIPNFLDFEQYLLEVEARSDELLEKMKVAEEGDLRLSKMIAGKSQLDVVRIFMMLLFLAQRMEIDLDQDEDETDVTIKVRVKNL